MRVVDAVRRSMSIPLFFRAVRDDRKDVFVDGGAINNYPVKLFDREKYLEDGSLRRIPKYYEEENKTLAIKSPRSSPYVYNKEALGFRLDSTKEIGVFRDGQEPHSIEIKNFLDYTMQLTSVPTFSFYKRFCMHEIWEIRIKTIVIDLSFLLKTMANKFN
jgi:NTE family protein